MNTFSYHVGQRIKKYRKSRGYTIEQFSAMINKSKATLSKYENGSITIDIETLYDISNALGVDLKCFVDYQPPAFPTESVLPKNFYFNQPKAYMYYYDGRVRQLVRSLLRFSPSPSGNSIDVMLYLGITSFNEPDRCQHLFTGEMKPYDTITHMVLTNQINEAEKMYICMLNPMHTRTPAVGLLSGIGSTPFFAPIALKTLISKEPLAENEKLFNAIKLDKDDYHLLRYYNMMVVNRPASALFD
jgi:transcriptional regulator with XRE-family HTH domain